MNWKATTVADIRKLVAEHKKVTPAQLVEALEYLEQRIETLMHLSSDAIGCPDHRISKIEYPGKTNNNMQDAM